MRGGDEQRLGRSNTRRIGAGKSREIVLRLSDRVRRNLLNAMRAADLSRMQTTLVVKIGLGRRHDDTPHGRSR